MLLEKARAAKTAKSLPPEAVALALRWVHEDLCPSTVCRLADGNTRSKTGRYAFLARALAQHVRSARLADQGANEIQTLALAWARREVNLIQVAAALGVKQSGSVYPRLARALRGWLRSQEGNQKETR